MPHIRYMETQAIPVILAASVLFTGIVVTVAMIVTTIIKVRNVR